MLHFPLLHHLLQDVLHPVGEASLHMVVGEDVGLDVVEGGALSVVQLLECILHHLPVVGVGDGHVGGGGGGEGEIFVWAPDGNGACAGVNAKGDASTASSLYSRCIPDPIGVRKSTRRNCVDATPTQLGGAARARC